MIVCAHVCMDESLCDSHSHLPILNSLLAMRISALGMMGGGRQNCSLYALRRASEDMRGVKHRISATCLVRHAHPFQKGNLHTLIVDMKQSALLCVTTKTNQHLIGCAAGGLIGLSISEDSQFPCGLLRTIPKWGGGEAKVSTINKQT